MLDVVALAEDMPEDGLKAGMVGSIVEVYESPAEAYEVEFCDPQGREIYSGAFFPGQLLPVEK
ncbi:DUF4926 domain-containing protein [Xanthomonas prunicola]|uniref:DUF4926 domain-containing protein n=1 Tax=Xanthomonas prunicola TaxID=2053930 RepID=UPI0021B34646|nr:DUF4926 domain-containing protein [Xanthomonas prunicola]UXA70869.1 DUF4926 domain-containing protein [Xanthomonas prunicola]